MYMKYISLLVLLMSFTLYLSGQENAPPGQKVDPLLKGMVLRSNSREKAVVIRNNKHLQGKIQRKRAVFNMSAGLAENLANSGMVLRSNSRDKKYSAINNQHKKFQIRRNQAIMLRQKFLMQRKMQIQQRRRIIQRQILRKKRLQQQIIRRRRQKTR